MKGEYIRLVVPVNGTPGDRRAMEVASLLAAGRQAQITLVYVVEVAQSMPLDAELPQELEFGESVLGAAEAEARSLFKQSDHQVITDLLQARMAGSAIVDEALERHADSIIMSARRRVKHGRASIGETIQFVARNAPCEVIFVRVAPEHYND